MKLLNLISNSSVSKHSTSGYCLTRHSSLQLNIHMSVSLSIKRATMKKYFSLSNIIRDRQCIKRPLDISLTVRAYLTNPRMHAEIKISRKKILLYLNFSRTTFYSFFFVEWMCKSFMLWLIEYYAIWIIREVFIIF